MTPQHIVARELAANADALRALARDLVGPADAADLVQETALRALRSPPRQPRGLGAWLSTVLRNLAGNHHRSAKRRRARELAASGPDPVHPPAAEDAQRRESLRSVTEVLWRLPEPYQSTLVWRYFENLTPKQIAEQKGIPLATVKSRLQRGLALLRVEFDRRDGGRWRAVLPLALGVSHTPAAAVAVTALIMTPTTKMLSAAAILAAAACLVFVWDNTEPPPVRAGNTAELPAAATVAGDIEERPADDQRELVVAVSTSTVSLDHPYEYRLQCRVIDRDGLPASGAQVVIAPQNCTLNRWPQSTAGDGTVELEWRGRTETMTMAVGLMFNGHGQTLREVELRSGATRELVLLAEKGGGGGGCQAAMGATGADCRGCHWGAMLPHVFDPRLEWQQGLHPVSHFADLLLADPPHDQSTLSPGEEEEEMEFSESIASEDDVAASGVGSITGTVIGVDGEPVSSVTVIYGIDRDRPFDRRRTQKDGSFEFNSVGPGLIEVRAGGGRPGLGRATVEVFAGRKTQCRIQLGFGDVITGRVALPEGVKSDNWRVEYVAADESWIDGTRVGSDKTFRLANLPRGSGRLLLWSSNAYRLPVAIDTSVTVGSTNHVFDLRMVGLPTGVMRLRPMAGQSVAPEVDVYLWQLASRRGAKAQRLGDGSFQLAGLSPGFYRVAVHGAGFGWHPLGEHWVGGEGVVDLGNIRLPDPARLRIEGIAPDQLVELYLRRPEADLRGAYSVGRRRRLDLPPGRWLALWGEPENLRMREFEVGAEGETLLDLASTPR